MSRNKQVDGLRGTTILMILIFHIFYRYDEIYMNETGGVIRLFGSFGNTIFLLISSYYLT